MSNDTDFWIKAGDTSPNIEATLKDANDNAEDLSTASSVGFHMKDSSGTVVVDAAATITDSANGKVEYSWSSGDTDTAGIYEAEWEVSWNDGSTGTYPNFENVVINITEEIA